MSAMPADQMHATNATEETAIRAQDATFASIAGRIGNSLSLHVFTVDNGATIHARRKVTYSRGLVKTAYLHIIIVYPSGKREYYREQPSGSFRTQ